MLLDNESEWTTAEQKGMDYEQQINKLDHCFWGTNDVPNPYAEGTQDDSDEANRVTVTKPMILTTSRQSERLRLFGFFLDSVPKESLRAQSADDVVDRLQKMQSRKIQEHREDSRSVE